MRTRGTGFISTSVGGLLKSVKRGLIQSDEGFDEMALEKWESGSWEQSWQISFQERGGGARARGASSGNQRGGGLGVCRIGTAGRDNRDYGWTGSQGKEKNWE